MSVAKELCMLFHRDLLRLSQELSAFPSNDVLWATMPGISNSAGHLTLHLEGNLREFIGLRLGGIPYTRDRPQEFAGPAITAADLLARATALSALIEPVLAALSAQQLDAEYPQDFLGRQLSTCAFLIHLSGHLQWHLGQIDYLRRALTGSGAIPMASL